MPRTCRTADWHPRSRIQLEDGSDDPLQGGRRRTLFGCPYRLCLFRLVHDSVLGGRGNGLQWRGTLDGGCHFILFLFGGKKIEVYRRMLCHPRDPLGGDKARVSQWPKCDWAIGRMDPELSEVRYRTVTGLFAFKRRPEPSPTSFTSDHHL